MTSSTASDGFFGLEFFIHPLPLGAVVLMVLNDHWLKFVFPSEITGKLSDFAGVFFLPLFLCALWLLGQRLWSRDRRLTLSQIFVAIALTDLLFVSVELIAPVTRVYLATVDVLGFPSHVTKDASDLIALAMNAPTWCFARRFVARSGPQCSRMKTLQTKTPSSSQV